MFTAESGGYSVWDDLEDNPQFHERNPDQGLSEPIERQGFTAPYDVLVPRPELGPNVHTLFRQGDFVPLSMMPKKPDGTIYLFKTFPRP